MRRKQPRRGRAPNYASPDLRIRLSCLDFDSKKLDFDSKKLNVITLAIGFAVDRRARIQSAITGTETLSQGGSDPGSDTQSRGGAFAPPTENPKRAISFKLIQFARQLTQEFDRRVDQAGLSRAKWRVIVAVSRQPGVTQRVIADSLDVSEVTAGRLIDRLCADGYLERRENPSDRRAHYVYLLPAAGPVLVRLGELAAAQEEEAFSQLSDSDIAKLEALLDAVGRNIAASRPDPPPLCPELPKRVQSSA